MKSKSLFMLVCVVAAVLSVGMMTIAAQEAYPLEGTWYGDYTTGNRKTDLTVIMKWDGKSVSGLINPGPNAKPLTFVALDITPGKPAAQGQQSTTGIPPTYKVRFEADGMTFEGTLRNPVAGSRQLVGTWKRDAQSGSFQIRRL